MAKQKKKLEKEMKKKSKANEDGRDNGRSELLKRLNYALSLEYAASIQYMTQQCLVKGLDRQDYAPFFATSSSESHLHALNLGNKISALGGVPTVEPGKVRQSSDLSEMLSHDLQMEREALNAYIKAWEISEENHALRFWLEDIIREEQLHVEELEKLTGKHPQG